MGKKSHFRQTSDRLFRLHPWTFGKYQCAEAVHIPNRRSLYHFALSNIEMNEIAMLSQYFKTLIGDIIASLNDESFNIRIVNQYGMQLSLVDSNILL